MPEYYARLTRDQEERKNAEALAPGFAATNSAFFSIGRACPVEFCPRERGTGNVNLLPKIDDIRTVQGKAVHRRVRPYYGKGKAPPPPVVTKG